MDFLKSFIFPLKMRRFRSMSVFIAISIFLVATYLTIIPVRVKYSNKDYIISKNYYLTKNFYDATTDFDYDLIKANNFVLDTKELVLSGDIDEVKVYKIDSIIDNKNYTFNIIYDLDKDNLDQAEDLYMIYDLEKKEASCVVLFSSKFYELQNVKLDNEEKLVANTIQGSTYKGLDIDFNNCNNANEFLDMMASGIAKLYGDMYIAMFTLTSILMVLVLPLLLVFVMWLVLRKNGSLKLFKEYYNVASIASVVPVLIAFGVAWFWPQVVNFYTTAFVMFYLFVIYRINAYPIDYEEVKEKK